MFTKPNSNDMLCNGSPSCSFATTWSCATYTAHINLHFHLAVPSRSWLISEVFVIYDQSPFIKSVYLWSWSTFALKLKNPWSHGAVVDVTLGLLSPLQVCLYTLKMAMMIWMTVSATIILYLTTRSANLKLFSCFFVFFPNPAAAKLDYIVIFNRLKL